MNFALLIARQRSGTGALGSVLDKHRELKYVGEVFHPDNLGQRNNFFTVLHERAATQADAALPAAGEENFRAFLDLMTADYPHRAIIIDVKYRSLHHLNGAWHSLIERPKILDLAMRASVPIIHLTRCNAVESFVSGRLADINKVWHMRETDKISVNSTIVNVRQLSNYIVNSVRDAELIVEWVGKYEKLLSFDYSELFDEEGEIATSIAEKIAACFGVGPFNDRRPVIRKQAPSALRDSIENFDLVRQALAGTAHAWMVR